MSRMDKAGVVNPARDGNQRNKPADAQQGSFQWICMLALSCCSTRVMYGPKPPLSERCHERGKRGKQGQSNQHGTATTIEQLSQGQRLTKGSSQNRTLSQQDSDFDGRRGKEEVRPARLPAKWKSGRPDGRAANKQSGIWILKYRGPHSGGSGT